MINEVERRFFVVSESELEALIISTADTVRASCNDEWRKLEKCEQLADKAEAACRARPFNRKTFAAICAEVDRQQKNGDFAGSFFEGMCKQLFGDEK